MVLVWVVILYQVKNTFWRYSNIDLHVWIMTGPVDHPTVPARVPELGTYHQLPFSYMYFLVLVFYGGAVLLWCINVYLYVCTDNIQNIDIGTLVLEWVLILCMCRYLGGFLGSRGTSLVSQWHRLPLRGHQSHFPCICSRWHLGSTLSWRRMVILWHGAVRWYLLMCCIIQMT